jgi:glycosyltransferase 2 family protein
MKWRVVQLLLGIAMSASLVFLLLRTVDTSAVASMVGIADPRPIALAIGVYILAMWLRSVLWRRLLPAANSTTALFRASIVGFAVNYLMPLRVGEFARVYLVRKWCGVEYGTTFASLVAERVLDGLAVGLILLAGLQFVSAPGYVLVLGLVVAAIFGGLATALIIASWRANAVIGLVSFIARPLPERFGKRAERLAQHFAFGLMPLRNWRALPGLASLSIAGWLCQFAVFYLLMLAFPLPASLPLAVLGGGVANFATLLPSAPGYVGTFDAALIKLVIDVQGASLEYATAYALVVHAVLVVPIVSLAGVIMWRANLSIGQLFRRALPGRPSHVPVAAAASVSTSVFPSLGA